MRVDIVDLIQGQAKIALCMTCGHLHRTIAAFRAFRRRRDVVRIAGQTIPRHFGVNLGTARFGVLIFLEHQYGGSLAHDKPIAGFVIWT